MPVDLSTSSKQYSLILRDTVASVLTRRGEVISQYLQDAGATHIITDGFPMAGISALRLRYDSSAGPLDVSAAGGVDAFTRLFTCEYPNVHGSEWAFNALLDHLGSLGTEVYILSRRRKHPSYRVQYYTRSNQELATF